MKDIYESALQEVNKSSYNFYGTERLPDIGFSKVTSVLYPLGGEDVVYPGNIFPDMEVLYIIDQRSFKNVFEDGDKRNNTSSEIYCSELIGDSFGSRGDSIIVPVAMGGFWGMGGFDFTSPIAFYAYHNKPVNFINGFKMKELGTANLILARLKAGGAEIKGIVQENSKVHTISLEYGGKVRIVHYIQSYLDVSAADIEKDEGLQWLRVKVGDNRVDAVLCKGIPNPSVAFDITQEQSDIRDGNIQKLVVDLSKEHAWLVADREAMEKTLRVKPGSYQIEEYNNSDDKKFGYDDTVCYIRVSDINHQTWQSKVSSLSQGLSKT